MRREVLLSFWVFALAGAVAAAPTPAKKAVSVTLPVATVAQVEDFRTKTYPGRVVPVAQVNVVPQVSGEILEVGFVNGAVVKEGDLLFRLDSVKYQAAVKNAEAKVAECKANLSYAELSYTRHQKLAASHAVSQDAADNALSSRDSARAALAAAEADLVVARDNLKHCRIVAPHGGKLGTTLFTMGNYVTPSSGTLVTLIQTAPIRVRFSMSNGEFLELFGARNRFIRARGHVTLTLADGTEYAEKGEVEYVENAADEMTDTIQVYALFPNAERVLKPGGTVVVTLSSTEPVRCTAVPPNAVVMDMKGAFVWLLGPGDVAEKRYVDRGPIVQEMQTVRSGLRPGERIVADGVHKVVKGAKIVPFAGK